jgi:hypothetical protein
MLHQAEVAGRQYAGQRQLWQHPYAAPQPRAASALASVWFTDESALVRLVGGDNRYRRRPRWCLSSAGSGALRLRHRARRNASSLRLLVLCQSGPEHEVEQRAVCSRFQACSFF